MGWTHYWKRTTELPRDQFVAAMRDCRKVLPALGIPLGGFPGTGTPHFADDGMAFNGAGARCEPFEIHQTEFDRHGRKLFWSFCKTERQPYDLCVQGSWWVMSRICGIMRRSGKEARRSAQEPKIR
jgi:hypothetical protein